MASKRTPVGSPVLVDEQASDASENACEVAEAAGLCYVSDALPGIRRKRQGKHFRYLTPDGKILRDPQELERIQALHIPPAWSDV